MTNITERFTTLIKKADNIVISTHIFPDADGIGSAVALCLAIKAIGKSAICVNEEELLERFDYLDPEHVVISLAEYTTIFAAKKIDLFIVVDTNSINRIGDGCKKLAQQATEILYIDHHPCSPEIMQKHCINTEKAATGELAGDLIQSLGVKLTQHMALPLYTAILIDTSSFRYPTVTGNTHRLIGSLMDAGVTPPYAYNQIYGTKKISFMQLLGKILAGVKNTSDEKIAWLTLTEDLLNQFNVDTEDTHAFINHLLILDNIKIAVMFKETGKHIKVSFRSLGLIDVGAMAASLGGGGHDHSAATIIEGKLEDVIQSTIAKLQILLAEAEKKLMAH